MHASPYGILIFQPIVSDRTTLVSGQLRLVPIKKGGFDCNINPATIANSQYLMFQQVRGGSLAGKNDKDR